MTEILRTVLWYGLPVFFTFAGIAMIVMVAKVTLNRQPSEW